MKQSTKSNPIVAAVSAAFFLGSLLSFAEKGPQSQVGVESGTATFEAVTNMPGIEVKGKSNSLSAHVEVVQDGGRLALQRIEASLPVKSLVTGMKVRDEHMRKYIFTAADGQEPDLRFEADQAACSAHGAARDYTCQVSGAFSMRGESRPFSINLRVKEQTGSALAFRVEGDGIVKLSDYGIAPPSQFGVKPANEVKIHLDFAGKEGSLPAVAGRGR
jgi:polyisoprenoid-binding protein YceI